MLVLAAPSGIALAVLGGTGRLSPGWVALGFIGLLLATGLVLHRHLRGLAALGAATASLARGETPQPPRRADPLVLELWHGLMRLARELRQRLVERTEALAAARAVLAALPDPLILLDARRRILEANLAAEALLGAALGGRDLAAALRDPAVLAAADAVLGGAAARRVEFTLPQPAERILGAEIVALPPGTAGANAALLLLRDLTAAKRSERMRADFVANASHELRTPLAALLGFVETLRGPARDDRAAQDRFLAIMHEQASRMARLIDDLLSLSRIEMNEHSPPTGRVDLGRLLGGVAAGFQLRAAARGMSIALDVPPGLRAALGDPDELAQVFQNLLDNAVKYAGEGTPITVSARLVEGGRGGARIAVAVKDRGEGIARQHLPRLTERFYRVDTARSRAMGGTGLGLAIVKHIVSRHRGALDIASEPGEGSVFTVLLRPAATAAAGG